MYGQGQYYPLMQSTQQRLQMMEAQYPQYANPPSSGYTQPMAYPGPAPTNNPQPQIMIKGRPVSNEEEANAAMIDYDGSLFIFPDKAHGKIYTKQLGMDGNILFQKYSLEVAGGSVGGEPTGPDLSIYPTREELKKELMALQNYIGKLEQQIKSLKGGNGK